MKKAVTEKVLGAGLLKKNLFFWLWWVFVGARGLSPVVASKGPCPCAARGLFIEMASLVVEHGLSSCGPPGSGAQAQWLSYTSFLALWHMDSSLTRDLTHVSSIGRWILTMGPPGKL